LGKETGGNALGNQSKFSTIAEHGLKRKRAQERKKSRAEIILAQVGVRKGKLTKKRTGAMCSLRRENNTLDGTSGRKRENGKETKL